MGLTHREHMQLYASMFIYHLCFFIIYVYISCSFIIYVLYIIYVSLLYMFIALFYTFYSDTSVLLNCKFEYKLS